MPIDRSRRRLASLLLAAVLITACAPSTSPGSTSERGDSEQRFPDVVAAELEPAGDTWRLSATLSSPYDTPERYADAFRALAEDGTVLGVRELAHHHANEQPFTRSLTGLEIPDDVERITVEGRDLANGWGGATVDVEVPPRSGASG